jgi:hypothetical protein
MAGNKTTETTKSVMNFVNAVEDEQQRRDSFKLIELMKNISVCEPKMWGQSIIGFGSYHYKYESGHEGDAPLIGFSPRKSAISLYINCISSDKDELLKELGKFKMGKACIYVKRLSDINERALALLMERAIKFLRAKYGSGGVSLPPRKSG